MLPRLRTVLSHFITPIVTAFPKIARDPKRRSTSVSFPLMVEGAGGMGAGEAFTLSVSPPSASTPVLLCCTVNPP